MISFLWNIDANILLWIQDYLRNSIATPIFIFVTRLGDSGMIWLILSLFLLLFRKTRKAGVISLLALLFSLFINNLVLKNLIARTRPYEVIANLRLLIEPARDYSFPSGHTGSSFAAAGVLYRKLPKKYGIPSLVLAFLIAFSRLYIGIHYPSDVLAGILTGLLSALLAYKTFEVCYRYFRFPGLDD